MPTPAARSQSVTAATVPTDGPASSIVIDTRERNLHRSDDLVRAGLVAAAFLGVLVLSVYATHTTTAVTTDVTSALAKPIRQISLVPVRIIENFVTLLVPLWAWANLAWRRQWRTLWQTVCAGVVGIGLAHLVAFAFAFSRTNGPFAALLIEWNEHMSTVAISPSLAGLTALLKMSGERSRDAHARAGWAATWTVLGLLVIQGRMTLVSALATVLIGMFVGALARYIFGMPNRRASGEALVSGLLTLGITPQKVVRVDGDVEVSEMEALTVALPTSVATESANKTTLTPPVDVDLVDAWDRARRAVGLPHSLPRYIQANRLYAVWDPDGTLYLVEATDADKVLASRLSDWWSRLRLRGTEHSESATIRDRVEHTQLAWMSAHSAGVRTPTPLGIARASASFVAAFRLDGPLAPFTEDADVSDDTIIDMWRQIRRAHARGLTHRNLDDHSIVRLEDGRVTITHWDQGEAAASELSQLVDLAQMLAFTSLLVGQERALDIAQRTLGTELLTSLVPVLQPIALPQHTRERVRTNKLLAPLREGILALSPAEPYDVPAVDLRGFSLKTLLITVIGVVALIVVFSTLNFAELLEVLTEAVWWWLAVGYLFSLLNAPAQTLILKAVCPEKLGWVECTAVQLAGSLTSLVAPTGVGVAALNLRYLNKQRVATPLALATVSLMQAFQFVVTVVLLFVFVGFTGTSIAVNFFSGPLLWAVVGLSVAVAVFFTVPAWRTWAVKKLSGPLAQIWPRVVWVMGSPARIVYASAGVIAMVVTQVLCFGCALLAFGDSLSFSSLAVTFLVSNTVGSLVPTPGGLGPIEASLTGGLKLAGISAAVALSAALTYRLLTFWGRAPVGWIALKFLQKRGIL